MRALKSAHKREWPQRAAWIALNNRSRCGATTLRRDDIVDFRKTLEDVEPSTTYTRHVGSITTGSSRRGTVQQRGYEGLGAKDERAPYSTTLPASAWWKVKVRHEKRCVIVGLAIAEAWPCSLLVAGREGALAQTDVRVSVPQHADAAVPS